MNYYAMLCDPPHDISVRLVAKVLGDAIRETMLLSRDAMIGTDRHDADYYLGVQLNSESRESREEFLAAKNCMYVADCMDFDGVRWSLFATLQTHHTQFSGDETMTTTIKTQWQPRRIPIAPDVCSVTDYWCGVLDAADQSAWYPRHWVQAQCEVHPDGRITHSVVGPVIDEQGRVVEWFPRANLMSRPAVSDREYRERLARIDSEGARLPGGGRPALLDQWDEQRLSTAEYRAARLRELQSRFNG